jgi:hypothetical protein
MARLAEPVHTTELPPKTAWLAAIVTCVVGTMLLAYPALGGKFLLAPYSDQYIAGYAFREFGASVLKATGGFALWNPYQFGGMPFVAGMHGDIFYPTAFLRTVLPVDVAMTWGFILHMMLAGIATYGFLRASKLTFAGALVGGVAYMMSGWVASYASPGHDGKLFVSALFPVALWCLLRGIRDGRLSAWGGLAITIALAALSPHPQLFQYLLIGSGTYALWLAFGSTEAPARPLAIRRLAFALGAVVLGMACSAIQYLPLMEYTPWSPRSGGHDYATATSYSFPIEELISTFVPQFSGLLDAYWGRNGIHYHSEYVGAAVWVLVLAALRSTVRTRETWFWVGMVTLYTLWALGGHTPFYQIPLALVPGTKFFRAPSTIFYIANFALAVLAGMGAQSLLRAAVSRRFLLIVGSALGVVALLGVSGGLSGLASAVALPGREGGVEANSNALMIGSLRSVLFATLVLVVMVLRSRETLSSVAAGWALVAVVLADQTSVLKQYWQFMAPASVTYATDPTIEYLKKATAANPGRILQFDARQASAYHDPNFQTGLMVHKLRVVRGYHGNELGRYQQMYGLENGGRNMVNPNFWQLYNVRYIMSDVADLGMPDAKLVAGPARNAAGSMVYIYELPGNNPAAWVAPAIVKSADSVTFNTVLDPRFTVHSVAIFNDSAQVAATPNLTELPAPLDLPVQVTRYDPGAIDLTLSKPAPAGAALVVSENFYPGWTATADGKPVETARADYALIGVPLPTGATKVSLRFASATYERGKGITLVACALALLALIGGALVDRRGPRVA